MAEINLIEPLNSPNALNFWIGGAGDYSGMFGMDPSNIMKWVKEEYFGEYGGNSKMNHYRGHEHQQEIVDKIVKIVKARSKAGKSTHINLIGHSWGGHTAMKISNALEDLGIKVNGLITIDPVSTLPFTSPRNQKSWINVYQEQTLLDHIATVPLLGQFLGGILGIIPNKIDDTVATFGGQLGTESNATHNIEVKDLSHKEALKMLRKALEKVPEIGGFNKSGFDANGYDKSGFDKNRLDKDGYDKNGFDKNGYDREGFNNDGEDRLGDPRIDWGSWGSSNGKKEYPDHGGELYSSGFFPEQEENQDFDPSGSLEEAEDLANEEMDDHDFASDDVIDSDRMEGHESEDMDADFNESFDDMDNVDTDFYEDFHLSEFETYDMDSDYDDNFEILEFDMDDFSIAFNDDFDYDVEYGSA